MNKRFQKWLDYNDINSNKLAENINVSRATISHIMSGRNKPSVDFLHKILKKYPDLNLNWLVTGVGSMKIDNNIKEKKNSVNPINDNHQSHNLLPSSSF